MTKLFETVGKENFDDLNKLFHIFNENFAGFKFYNVLSDLQEKRETEGTKMLNEIIKKRDQILARMEEHSKKRESKS